MPRGENDSTIPRKTDAAEFDEANEKVEEKEEDIREEIEEEIKKASGPSVPPLVFEDLSAKIGDAAHSARQAVYDEAGRDAINNAQGRGEPLDSPASDKEIVDETEKEEDDLNKDVEEILDESPPLNAEISASVSGNNNTRANFWLRVTLGPIVGENDPVTVTGIVMTACLDSPPARLTAASNDDPLPDLVTTKRLIKTWQAIPEKIWWKHYADFIGKSSFMSLNDQIFFLRLIMQLSPQSDFMWDSNKDRLNLVHDLADYYNKEPTTYIGDIYAKVLDMYADMADKNDYYKNLPLPRSSVAYVLILTIGKIYSLSHTIKRPPQPTIAPVISRV